MSAKLPLTTVYKEDIRLLALWLEPNLRIPTRKPPLNGMGLPKIRHCPDNWKHLFWIPAPCESSNTPYPNCRLWGRFLV